MSLENCHLIDIPEFFDSRGILSVLEGNSIVPFDIKRLFYMRNLVGIRGNHAHRVTKQFLIALCGEFRVVLKEKKEEKEYVLNSPNVGLYIDPMIWVVLDRFSVDAFCIALASEHYCEEDYIRDLQELGYF
ncbi:MAG: sugar 3,4-ketoisomerase [Candidatus Hodarchaeales archaeon]